MPARKKAIKIALISSLSVAFMILGAGLVYSQTSHKPKAVAEGYTNTSQSGDAAVLGESTATIQASEQKVDASKPAASAPSTSVPKTSSTPAPTATTPVDGGPSLNPNNTYNPTDGKGFVAGKITTDVGGSACGFPMGFCPVPYQATVDVKDAEGNIVTTVQSDSNGDFGLKLVPGTYTIVPRDGDVMHHPSQASYSVTIVAGQTVDVHVYYYPDATTNQVIL